MDTQAMMEALLNEYGVKGTISIALLAILFSALVNWFFDFRRQKNQAFLDTKVHITKAQFEVEYEAYRKIWDSLIDVRNHVLSLESYLDNSQNKESVGEKEKRRTIQQANYNFFVLVEKNRPFYDPSVYESLNNIFPVLSHEHTMYQIEEILRKVEEVEHKFVGDKQKLNKHQTWIETKEGRELVLDRIKETGDTIRGRIASISVVE